MSPGVERRPRPRPRAARARRRAPAGGGRRRRATSRPSGANSAADSGVEVTIPAEDLDHVAPAAGSARPRHGRARAAGSTSSASGIRPNRREASRQAQRQPVGPDRCGADVEHLDRVAERDADRDELGPLGGIGAAYPVPRRRSRAARARCPARRPACTRRRPSALSSGSQANDASIAAIAASTALPPWRSTSAPVRAVVGWPAATTPSWGPAIGDVLSPGHELWDVELERPRRRTRPHAADTRLAARLAAARALTDGSGAISPGHLALRLRAVRPRAGVRGRRRNPSPRPSPTPGPRASRRPSRRR